LEGVGVGVEFDVDVNGDVGVDVADAEAFFAATSWGRMSVRISRMLTVQMVDVFFRDGDRGPIPDLSSRHT